MIPIFAWRNLWRNKLRSLIIITAFIIGIFAGVFIIAFLNGMINSRVQAVIGTELSHIQVHMPGFLENDQFSLHFKVSDSLLHKITQMPHVVAVSKRIVVNSMVASPETSLGVKITGVDPQQEIKVTTLYKNVFAGQYFGGNGRNQVLISEKLAKKLKVSLHNKIVITLQDENNNITGGAFRIVGLYRTDNLIFDEANIFVRNSDLASLTGISGDDAHELAIRLDKDENTEQVTKAISKALPRMEVKDWLQLSPDAGAIVSAMNQYTYIFTLIILLALCFSIVNTMLMVIMERIGELGMLMAIGMNRVRVFSMIMLETIFLSLTGGMIGVMLGWAVSKYFEHHGINLYFWKEAFGELGFTSMVYPVIGTRVLVITTLMVIAAGIVSAVYPALKAIRLKPSEAIHSA